MNLNDQINSQVQTIRNQSRIQASQNTEQLDDICQSALADLERGNEILQKNSLETFINILESDRRDELVIKYGENLIEILCYLIEDGLTEEIQAASLVCASLCYQYRNLSSKIISRPAFILFLIENRLNRSISEANASFNLLSIVAFGSSKRIEGILQTNIFEIIASIPPVIEYGQLINVIIDGLPEIPPQIEQLCAIIIALLSSENPNNVSAGLSCIQKFIKNQWECFNIEDFHSNLPGFLQSTNAEISSTAFQILQCLPPNETDLSAVLNVLAQGGPNSYYALSFLIHTKEQWASNPPPSLFTALLCCLSQSGYKNTSLAISLLIPALAAKIEFTPDAIKQLANLLADDQNFRYIGTALLEIWKRIQSQGNTEWFVNIIAEHADILEETLGNEEDGLMEISRALLAILP